MSDIVERLKASILYQAPGPERDAVEEITRLRTELAEAQAQLKAIDAILFAPGPGDGVTYMDQHEEIYALRKVATRHARNAGGGRDE